MFAFVKENIVFLSITLLNDNNNTKEEGPGRLLQELLIDNKHWISKQLLQKKDEYPSIRGIVIFGHAMLSYVIRPFFENDLKPVIFEAGLDIPVLYIHGDGHRFAINNDFGRRIGWSNLSLIQVDQGGLADPILVEIAPFVNGSIKPFTIDNPDTQLIVSGGLFQIDRSASLRTFKLVTDFPSQSPSHSMVPSISPSSLPTFSPTTHTNGICGDFDQKFRQPCVPIGSWNDFKRAIRATQDEVILCPFQVTNDDGFAIVLNKDISIICPSQQCILKGPDSQLRVVGSARVTISGMTFSESNHTAVHVLTSAYAAETTFCRCKFHSNQRTDGAGGAIRMVGDSGVVNLVDSDLYYNRAIQGGAILLRVMRLNVISCNFTGNLAAKSGGSIFAGGSAHILVRGSMFSHNKATSKNYSINLLAGNQTEVIGTFTDARDNVVVDDGGCSGFYVESFAKCHEFLSSPASPNLVYPYVPGELSKYDSITGLLLATGLSVRQLAKSGEPVVFTSVFANQDESVIPFHLEPDGAAIIPNDDGGWVYVSNSEQSRQPIKGTGGVYAIDFDSNGEIRNYRPLLVNTTRNCAGGLTPWNTWVSCEEVSGGQCWQVHPFGKRDPEPTSIGEEAGGSFEAFTYDIRNSMQPCFFVTEDHERGALRRWCPHQYLLNETWKMLHGSGTHYYLKIIPGTNRFEWTTSLEEGRQSAQDYFPLTEGISHDGNGTLYFVSKRLKSLFICNLDTLEYRTEQTNDSGLMVGDGSFNEQPDHVVRSASNDKILYFTEDVGRPGVYGRRTSTGMYFAVMEAVNDIYQHDEATGLAWSPDWKRLYVCIQDKGLLFEIQRDDGMPFDHNANQLRLKYHSYT